MPDSKLDLVLGSIEAVLRGLARLPTSPEVKQLTDRALECERAVKAWPTSGPTPAEREVIMKRVLGLHAALSVLERA
jgi:hypothetical protein